jgi:hypothetical protein
MTLRPGILRLAAEKKGQPEPVATEGAFLGTIFDVKNPKKVSDARHGGWTSRRTKHRALQLRTDSSSRAGPRGLPATRPVGSPTQASARVRN